MVGFDSVQIRLRGAARKSRPVGLLVGVLLASAVVGCATAPQGSLQTAAAAPPLDQRNIVYASPDGMDLKLDIMVPSVGRGPFPAIVFFPGNGFGFYYTIDRSQCRAHLLDFVEKGYVVLEADVRSCVDWAAGVPTSPYPAPLYDAKSVIRWLRANAAQYHVDTNRIGVAGWSSGGTLALTLALTRPEDGLEGDVGVLGYPTDVRAAAVTGVMVDFDFDEIEQKVGIVTYLGVPHSDSPELYRSASPIRFLREGAPPIFQVEGESDHFSVDQAPSFHARLTELGIPNELFVVPGLGHNDYLGRTQTLAFFDRYLKGGAASADQ